MKERDKIIKKSKNMTQTYGTVGNSVGEESDDDFEGRSIRQEVDYSNKKKASKTI